VEEVALRQIFLKYFFPCQLSFHPPTHLSSGAGRISSIVTSIVSPSPRNENISRYNTEPGLKVWGYYYLNKVRSEDLHTYALHAELMSIRMIRSRRIKWADKQYIHHFNRKTWKEEITWRDFSVIKV
jgi:hypothetical protein